MVSGPFSQMLKFFEMRYPCFNFSRVFLDFCEKLMFFQAIDQDIKELEKSKQSYIEKNKQQQQVIATFNKEVGC